MKMRSIALFPCLLVLAVVSRVSAEAESSTVEERLPPKIHRIQKDLPAWIEHADDGDKENATALMRKLKDHLDAHNFEEAEKTADSVLKMMSESAKVATQEVPEETLSKLTHRIGSTFLVFREKVQRELKVTTEQKQKLDRYLGDLLPGAQHALEETKGERDKYNETMHGEMAPVLKDILDEGQRTRLHQLELQRDGLFGAPWNSKELQITDEQRQQFMVQISQTQQSIKELMDEIQKGADTNEIRPKILKLRSELEGKLEDLLTDPQRKQWKEMLGEPVDLSVLFDGVQSR